MRRLPLGVGMALCVTLVLAGAAVAVDPTPTPLPALPGTETVGNDTPATATPIANGTRIRGSIDQAGDVDLYSFSAQAGDRVYAAVTTQGSTTTDADLRVLATDGTTALGVDQDDGTFASLAPSIAGLTLPSSGTFYLKVEEKSGVAQIHPYEVFLQTRSGAIAGEVEPNDAPGNATPFTGEASGVRSVGDFDTYSLVLEAGDTVFLSLDLDPEADLVTWNGRLTFGLFGDSSNQYLVANDPGTGDTTPSEALVMTVKQSGAYFIGIDAAEPAIGGPTATYRVSATVISSDAPSCAVYPGTVGGINDMSLTTFDIPVSDAFVIDRLALDLSMNHTAMSDLDVALVAPSGQRVEAFSDIGGTTQDQFNGIVDDNAGLPSVFNVSRGLSIRPDAHQLGWFAGTPALGTWTLEIRDDATSDVGTVTSAGLVLCPRPEIAPGPTTLFSADFETGEDGFTHSGVSDEWERGTPSTPATATANPVAGLATCAGGTGCFKTDLDGTYDSSSDQTLLSPVIDLTDADGDITAIWQQWLQIENPRFDQARVSVEEVGGDNSRTLYAWSGNTMTMAHGNPVQHLAASAGWSEHRGDLSDYAGKQVQLRFHLKSDSSLNFAGLAIDDVAVRVAPDPGPTPAPKATLKGSGTKAKGAKLKASCGALACTVKVTSAVVKGKTKSGKAKSLGKLKRPKAVSVAANKTRTIKAKPSKSLKRKIKKAKRPSATIKVKFTYAGGVVKKRTIKVKLK